MCVGDKYSIMKDSEAIHHHWPVTMAATITLMTNTTSIKKEMIHCNGDRTLFMISGSDHVGEDLSRCAKTPSKYAAKNHGNALLLAAPLYKRTGLGKPCLLPVFPL